MRKIQLRQLCFLLALFFCFHQPVLAALPSDIASADISEESNSPILINHLVNYDLFIRGRMITLNDTETWNRTVSSWNTVFANLGGYNDSGEEVLITLQLLDTSQVDLTKPGYYTVTVHLQIPEPFNSDYVLDESIQQFSIPICIADPQQLNLFVIGTDKDGIDLTWGNSATEPLTLYFINSPTVLTDEMLASASWNIYASNIPPTATVFSIQTANLTEGHEYYFYLESNNNHSNYVHFSYTNQQWNHEYMGGDRDGGDGLGNHLPDYEQPAPTISDSNFHPTSHEETATAPTSDTTASSSGEFIPSLESSSIADTTNVPEVEDSSLQELPSETSSIPNSTEPMQNSDSVVTESSSISQSLSDITQTIPEKMESASFSSIPNPSHPTELDSSPYSSSEFIEKFGETTDLISGSRILLMLQSGHGTAAFSKQNITVTLQESSLSTYNIQQSDQLQVTIEPLGNHSFQFLFWINGYSVNELPQICYKLPYQAASKDSQFSISHSSGETIPVQSYDPEKSILTFTSNRTGTFTINETSTLSSSDSSESKVESKTIETGTANASYQNKRLVLFFSIILFLFVIISFIVKKRRK